MSLFLDVWCSAMFQMVLIFFFFSFSNCLWGHWNSTILGSVRQVLDLLSVSWVILGRSRCWIFVAFLTINIQSPFFFGLCHSTYLPRIRLVLTPSEAQGWAYFSATPIRITHPPAGHDWQAAHSKAVSRCSGAVGREPGPFCCWTRTRRAGG